MKYVVIVGDGMADYPVPELGKRTPLQVARKPAMDEMACRGAMGRARTVPEGMPAGSDTANLTVMGYDPRLYHSGRSPFEAAGMGVQMNEGDISFRCNLVTLSGDEPYAQKTMLDYSGGEISTEEARLLIEAVSRQNSATPYRFYAGVSYRSLLIWPGGPGQWRLTPPHDITGKKIGPFLPQGPRSAVIREMMEQSFPLLERHPLNRSRAEKGLRPANSIWIWGEGRRPQLPLFADKYGLQGAVISAVDLVRGIGLYAGLELIEVEGATGSFNTNYSGKAEAALAALDRGMDFVYLHVEAPDECAHQYEIEKKIRSIELIDQQVVRPIRESLEKAKEPFKMLILPDHYTPLSLRTHTADAIPFLIYPGEDQSLSGPGYDEETAANTGLVFQEGHTLMDYFLGRPV